MFVISHMCGNHVLADLCNIGEKYNYASEKKEITKVLRQFQLFVLQFVEF